MYSEMWLLTFGGDIVYIKDFRCPSISAVLSLAYQLLFAVKNYMEGTDLSS